MTPNKHLHTINLICSWSQRHCTQDAVQMFLLYVRMFVTASNPHQRRITLTGWCIWLFIVAVLKEKESLVIERLGKTAFLYHLLQFALIYLGFYPFQTKNDSSFFEASNLSGAVLMFCHIQQAFLKDPMMDGSNQQKQTKCLMLKSVSCKSFMSVSSPSWKLCPVTQQCKIHSQSRDTYLKQVDTFRKMGSIRVDIDATQITF